MVTGVNYFSENVTSFFNAVKKHKKKSKKQPFKNILLLFLCLIFHRKKTHFWHFSPI